MSSLGNNAQYPVGEHPNWEPPVSNVGIIGWMKQNLFSSRLNTALTFLAIYLLYTVIPPVVQWVILDADWVGSSKADCTGEGACWVYINVWWKQIMYGRYPDAELWRVQTAYVLGLVGLIPLMIPNFPKKKWISAYLLFLFPFMAYILFYGGNLGLTFVETPLWGGLFLTLVIAITGIVASLPLGILLALGRRSNMPVIKTLCILFIEFWRGVPLITVLFMASVMFPLFLPQGVNFDQLLRALIGVALFSAAYMAEVVRGGLQAIPKGQYEAAQALGLSYWKTTFFIIMPQALKLVIPGIVNVFIALFKDTTLVSIIGLFDFLGMIQLVNTNPDWLSFAIEGYVFAAVIFWFFCFGMSRYSQHLEKKLHTGH
ncbi:MAG: amino acid ABC transporter permease [Gammaproteobacteria bacterium]|nr:amino acid ABC transporter permease [Gammaproteobacteria bacterium]